MKKKLLFVFGSFLLGSSLFSSMVLADLPPPNFKQCRDLKIGDPCKTDQGKLGKCASRTCSQTLPPKPGSSQPEERIYPCLTCEEGPSSSKECKGESCPKTPRTPPSHGTES